MKINILIAGLLLSATTLFSQVSQPIVMPYVDYPIERGDHDDVVQQHCLVCHSFGYMLNQGKKSRPYWTGTVAKMVNEFKAPIPKEDQQIIINYFVKHYGYESTTGH
ncbi:MAG TPA: sulfite:cytochrome C oxidoreductase subunit B [Sulfuricurvum sp.]|nr:MAG: sulfite:cytochrome C oxidoreductase subunit B [Campylobacterales bacterium 16-40-21]OZA02431.1 MAG: sulfite:cytochrome C oxidoreductase subunit B [Sulfuricurvum sp. 17-40-25]HQS67573.1 sulfite:cytochrome C oxidoreductase subunit B [Sulfuricurvum sp.]HQT36712.1 sulfite:cytochrome C oxidoreductase subunit B [Sulfuricurvum sp.]